MSETTEGYDIIFSKLEEYLHEEEPADGAARPVDVDELEVIRELRAIVCEVTVPPAVYYTRA